jgi:hypothetical protein
MFLRKIDIYIYMTARCDIPEDNNLLLCFHRRGETTIAVFALQREYKKGPRESEHLLLHENQYTWYKRRHRSSKALVQRNKWSMVSEMATHLLPCCIVHCAKLFIILCQINTMWVGKRQTFCELNLQKHLVPYSSVSKSLILSEAGAFISH